MKLKSTIFDTRPSNNVLNSQPHGIGRIAHLEGNLWAVNSLGKEIGIFSIDEHRLERIAVYDKTIFPEKDDESQFDLDMHALLLLNDQKTLLAVNHYGLMRFFDISECLEGPAKRGQFELNLNPFAELSWAGDVERVVMCGDYLVSTSSLGYSTHDGLVIPGLLVSPPLPQVLSDPNVYDEQSLYSIIFQEWGIITALAADDQMRIAFAAGDRIGILGVDPRSDNDTLPNALLWERKMPFHIASLDFIGDYVVAGGFGCEFSDHYSQNWNLIGEGLWATLSISTSEITRSEKFDMTPAWGNGSEPIGIRAKEEEIFALDRAGGLHVWRLSDGEKLYSSDGLEWDPNSAAESGATPGDTPGATLGIAHSDSSASTVLAGFNRGGYRLISYTNEDEVHA